MAAIAAEGARVFYKAPLSTITELQEQFKVKSNDALIHKSYINGSLKLSDDIP